MQTTELVEKRRRATPKFGPNGTTYGTKAERKNRNNHAFRKKVMNNPDAFAENTYQRGNETIRTYSRILSPATKKKSWTKRLLG